jgi:hypothetical protein
MSYQFNKIESTDYIGNSLSKINLNYLNLSEWTTNILTSSDNLYDPLNNFYSFYGDFWKDSVNFALSIKAKERLQGFETLVLENSAKWITPLIFYYPVVTKYEQNNMTFLKQNAITWFNQNYPITTSTYPNFAENTVAFLYCPLYEEELKIDTVVNIVSSSYCKTNDTSTTVYCWVTFNDNIACYNDYHACDKFGRTRAAFPNNPSCTKNFTLTCDYENNQNEITRTGRVNMKSYYYDRYENENILCLKLQVKNCVWQEIQTL